MKDYIRLDRLTSQENILSYQFSSSLDVFDQRHFFVEYRKGLPKSIESINTIPFAALMMPVAWASGADLILPSLDAAYARSLEQAMAYWKKCYGRRWPFDSNLQAPRVAQGPFPVHRIGQLFGGGIDSLSTYVHYSEHRPELFTVIGADFSLSKNRALAARKQKLYDEFSESRGVELTCIYSNVGEVLNLEKMKRYAENWYGAVQHALLLSALTAPVSYPYLKALVLASCSHKLNYEFPCGGEREVVENLHWADTRALSDLSELSRTQKIGLYLKGREDLYRFVRVCWAVQDGTNCSRCEKCLRTICELLLNNVDPNRVGFRVDERTLPDLRQRLENRFHLFFRGNENFLNFWRAIQENAALENLEDLYGSRKFFTWFIGFERLKEKPGKMFRQMLAAVLKARDAVSHSKREWSQRWAKILRGTPTLSAR